MEGTLPDVGRRVKRLREAHGLSLRTLAERSGLSVSAVSLIERGQSSPTVATLHRLSAALGVRIVEFFEDQEHETNVVFSPAGRGGKTQTAGALVESLGTGLTGQCLEPFLVTLEPTAGSGSEPITHSGQELVYGIDGRVDYTVDCRVYQVNPGDALLLDASLPHSWCNTTWQPACFLLVLAALDGTPSTLLPHLEE